MDLSGEPRWLRRRQLLVSGLSLLGSVLIVTAHHFDLINPFTIWGCVALVFGMRMVAVVLDVHAPKPLRTGDHP